MPVTNEISALIRPSENGVINYEKAVKELEHISRNNWRIGEIAASVETRYGEQTLQKLAEDSGIEYSALLVCRTVNLAWPFSARAENVSWTVHRAFASQSDRTMLIKQKKWTAKEAREEVQRRNSMAPPGEFDRLFHKEKMEELRQIVSHIKDKYGDADKFSSMSWDNYPATEKRQCAMAIIDAAGALVWLADRVRPFLEVTI